MAKCKRKICLMSRTSCSDSIPHQKRSLENYLFRTTSVGLKKKKSDGEKKNMRFVILCTETLRVWLD